jgi:ribose 5-phosphate isomerase
VDPDLNLVKGRGGALLREKVRALSAELLPPLLKLEAQLFRLGT